MSKHFCDRCGDEIPADAEGQWVALKTEGEFENWRRVCRGCADSFADWLSQDSDFNGAKVDQ